MFQCCVINFLQNHNLLSGVKRVLGMLVLSQVIELCGAVNQTINVTDLSIYVSLTIFHTMHVWINRLLMPIFICQLLMRKEGENDLEQYKCKATRRSKLD